METNKFDTLVDATNEFTKQGFTESFITENDKIMTSNKKNQYNPEELTVVASHRFDGMTNPSDESHILAIETNDGIKGTIITSYSSEHNLNPDLIKRIPSNK